MKWRGLEEDVEAKQAHGLVEAPSVICHLGSGRDGGSVEEHAGGSSPILIGPVQLPASWPDAAVPRASPDKNARHISNSTDAACRRYADNGAGKADAGATGGNHRITAQSHKKENGRAT